MKQFRQCFLLALLVCILFQGCGSGGDSALPSTGSTSETVTVASWNILNLGDSTDVSLRAKVIANFDIVALQEVESLTAMATVHITWGDSTAERVAEVERLDDVYNYIQGLSSSENDILICGDFNLDGPGHYAFSDLATSGALQTAFPTLQENQEFTTPTRTSSSQNPIPILL